MTTVVPAASLTGLQTLLSTDEIICARDGVILLRATVAALFASPELSGNPTAPTQSVGNSSTRIATTAFVDAAVGEALGSLNTDQVEDVSGLATDSPPTLTSALQYLGDSPTFTGNVTVNGALVTGDSMPKFASGNVAHAIDIGFYGQYQPAATPLYGGLFFDATDSIWKLFQGLEAEPTTTVDTAGTGFTYGPMSIGHLKLNALNASGRALDASTLVCSDVASAATFDLRLIARATANGAYTNRAADVVLYPEIASGVTNTSACTGLSITAYRNINAANTDAGTLTTMRGLSVVYGHINTVGGNAPATTNADGVVVFPTCRTGTIGTLRGFYVDPLSSSGGTVTTFTGFSAGALVGGTTTHAYRGQVASGSGRWNLFMDGTADNHLQGDTLLGTSTPTGNAEKLQVTGNVAVTGTIRAGTFTVATLPTVGTARRLAWASDLAGGAGYVVDNGAQWERVKDFGTATVATDAAFTLTVNTSAPDQVHTGTLTADRTITLSTTGAWNGARFRVTRTGAGAFNLSVGGLKNLATNTWAEVVYNGSAWVLAAYGTL